MKHSKFLEVCITTTLRPELLERTLLSFKDRMLSDPRLILGFVMNVDPVGPGESIMEPMSVLKSVFPGASHYVTINATEPHFGRAFVRIFEQSTYEWVFYLEDDWELVAPVDAFGMINLMERDPWLASLRLPWKPTEADRMKNWRHFFPWNGKYFECPDERRLEIGFCGHPSLLRGDWIREAVRYVDDKKNPEKQFHHGNPRLMDLVQAYKFGVFGQPNSPAVVQDIGRQWMIQNGYRKAGSKAFFTHWERGS